MARPHPDPRDDHHAVGPDTTRGYGGRAPLLAGIVLAVLFGAGLVALFRLRFESGDVYPAYSSLRGDPLGTRVLYESLASYPGLRVSRSHEPATRWEFAPDTALLFLGDTLSNDEVLPKQAAAALNSLVRRGARLVVTLKPRNRSSREEQEPEEETADTRDHPGTNAPPPGASSDDSQASDRDHPWEGEEEEEAGAEEMMSVTEWLGLAVADAPYAGAASATRHPDYEDTNLPPRVSCHTSVCFTNLTNGWRVVYARRGAPVVVERLIGRGTLVISALSFFVSNEALRYERHAALLAWLVGNAGQVVFDEYHHGIARASGIAQLARRYRLHGLGAGLVLLAALFVWRSGVGVVPADAVPVSGATPAETGKGSRSAIVNILRRNIPAPVILETTFDEWKRTADPRVAASRQHLAEAARIIAEERARPAGKRRPADVYNRLCLLLSPGPAAGAGPTGESEMKGRST